MSTKNPPTTPGSSGAAHSPVTRRERFRAWRQERPFLGCLIATLAAIWTYSAAVAPLGVIVSQGTSGILALGVCSFVLILALTTLFQPHLRSLTGLVILALGPLSILAINLGGFVVGMIMLVVGGGLIFAWDPAVAPDHNASAPTPTSTSAPTPTSTPASRRPQPAAAAVRAPKRRTPALQTMLGESTPTPQRERPSKRAGRPRATAAGRSAPQAGSSRPTARDQDRPPLRPGPPPAQARIWPALLVVLVALAMTPTGVASAGTSADTSASGWFDWLLPQPSDPPTPTPAPSPTPSSGLPGGLDKIPTPIISLPAQPAPGQPRETTATCPVANPGPGASRPGQPAEDAVEILRQCIGAVEEGLGLVSGAAPPPPAGTPAVSAEELNLSATQLTLKGAAYRGLVTLQTPKGPRKVMRFQADRVEVLGLDQTNAFDAGNNVLKNLQGTAILSGNVTLYVASISGSIFGLLPLTFDPKFQPPLVFDQMFFTNVKSSIPLVLADQILVPSLEIRIS